MAAPDQSKLVRGAMALRGRAPEEWDFFVRSMQEYAAQVVGQMVACPPEKLYLAQGMAIQAQEITATLVNAPTTYEQMLNNTRNSHGQGTKR